MAEASPQAHEGDQVDGGDQQQKDGGDGCADGAADGLERLQPVLHCGGGGCDGEGCENHDGGMTEGEKQPGVHGPFAVLHQLAHDVVDGGDMISVDGVAQAQHPGQECGAE